MNKVLYKLVIIVMFVVNTSYAQSFQKKYSNEIPFKKGGEVTLYANYADIEIKEWKKNRIKVDAIIKVEGVQKEEAQSHLNSWDISLSENNGKATIKSKFHSNRFHHFDFEDFNFEMPEISIESLGVLDSMDFSFPKMDFSEVFSDSIFKNIYRYDFSMDSISGEFDFEKLKANQEYLKEWQKANQENFSKLQKRAEMIAKRNKRLHEKRAKQSMKRIELAKMRTEKLAEIDERRVERHGELAKKRGEEVRKRGQLARKRGIIARKREEEARKRHKKIRSILKNRNKAKVRTKLTIYVPKGTELNMNVNYSKISTN